ncbi:hypothetical protein DFH08DRAFT_814978 [Mycena albidolilacea]|uniref:Uncharacterized protein n=1 Tax=Mycena albidolilacea TaxID=1033008 RepID=A0AAD6ZN50_9AGAR|nr:hypothetical protein DFH08DRAFT_814978 [Mycena albidolilacea]
MSGRCGQGNYRPSYGAIGKKRRSSYIANKASQPTAKTSKNPPKPVPKKSKEKEEAAEVRALKAQVKRIEAACPKRVHSPTPTSPTGSDQEDALNQSQDGDDNDNEESPQSLGRTPPPNDSDDIYRARCSSTSTDMDSRWLSMMSCPRRRAGADHEFTTEEYGPCQHTNFQHLKTMLTEQEGEKLADVDFAAKQALARLPLLKCQVPTSTISTLYISAPGTSLEHHYINSFLVAVAVV